MTRATTRLIALLTRALGEPVRDPEMAHRRWRCPACGGGEDDPARLWCPLVVTDDGGVWCQAEGCSPGMIGRAVRALLAEEDHGEMAA